MRASGWLAATTAASAVGLVAGMAVTMAVAADLEGTSWRAEIITGQPVADGVETTLRFEPDGKVAGTGGCNRFFGPVEIAGDVVTFGPVAATRMACPEPQSAQELRFFAALEAAERLTIDADGQLLLHGTAGGEPTRLTPVAD